MTITITTLSFSLGFLISSTLTLIRFFGGGIVSIPIKIYIDVFRGTPLLVQLLLIYFGFPSIGINLDAFTTSVIAIGLNSGAYQAEIMRTAIKGIPEDQVMVAKALGLKDRYIYLHIVMPQALRNAVPGLVNEFVMLLKESSLASVIGLAELTRIGEYMMSATFRALEAFTIVALIYLLLSYTFYFTSRHVEKRFAIPGFERWVR
jgi:His/Glu/Gln/Arg/opine family amino acid ABC transporter permease subunit